VPGYPQDQTAIGKASPVYGLTTAADPTVRAGAGGFFAYSFIAYNRGSNVGKVAVARFLDRNTTEAVTKPETAISYIDTKVWDSGSAGNFIDKPINAVTQGTGTCTVTTAGKSYTIPASTVHLAWTVFVGNNDDIVRTKVYYARSSNCGASLDGPPTKLSEGYAITQSASIAVAPNGHVYVVWRQFSSAKGDPNQILVAKSIDGGKSFTKGTPVPMPVSFQPFDQGTSSKTFRTNAFASTGTDQWGRLYVALAVRGFAQAEQSRVVLLNTLDGVVWNGPEAIENDPSAPGHQIMPAITTVGGNLNVVWIDFRDDVSGHYDPFIKEIYPIRHTMDVRGAQAPLNPNGTLVWNNYGIMQEALPPSTVPRISRYLVGDYQDQFGDGNLRQLQFNRPNLKLYAGGTRPFIGDFIDVAGLAFLAQQNGVTTTWFPNFGDPALVSAADTTAARTFYAFWTDNRDAKVGTFPQEPELASNPAAEGPMLTYNAPVVSGTCGNPALTKTRNANVYTSRITPGLFVAAPSNSKPSIAKATGERLLRAFSVVAQNRTDKQRTFRLTIANQPADFPTTGIASFHSVPIPFPTPLVGTPAPAYFVTTTEVVIPANSSASRTVFVLSTVKYPQIRVDVAATIVDPADEPLTGSAILNPDAQNADIENADIENGGPLSADIENKELHNADIENADIENADIENADIENADIENADIENADIENADIENADIENADIENADIENADIENADIENADIENADIENGAVSDFSVDVQNEGNTSSSYQVKFDVANGGGYIYQLIGRRVYKTPSANGCIQSEKSQNQILFNIVNPDVSSGGLPDQLNSSVNNATFLVAPGETIKVTLRAIDKDGISPAIPGGDGTVKPFCPIVDLVGANCPEVTNPITVHLRAEAPNTGTDTPFEITEVATATLQIATLSVPGAIVGRSYGPKTLIATGGTAPLTWSVQSGTLPAGLTLDGSTGTLSGIATTAGTSTFVVQVQDASSQVATRTYTIRVMSIAAGDVIVTDGLPDTTSGKLYSVSPAGAVQLFASVAGRPQSIVQDGNSYVVIDSTNHRVLRVTPGNVQTLYRGAPLEAPIAAVVTPAGDIVIADNRSDRVFRLRNGVMSTIGFLPSSETELQNIDMVVDPTGIVVVANDEVSSPVTLHRFDPSQAEGPISSVTTTVGSSGAIVLHSSGDYLIADYLAEQIRRVTAAGTTVSSINVAGIGAITGMTVAADESLYVSVLGGAVRHVPTTGGFTTVAAGSPFVMLTDLAKFTPVTIVTATGLAPAVYDSGPGTGGGRAYRQVLSATGIAGTATWTLDPCPSCTGLPFGVSLSSAGIVSGTPDAHIPPATPPPPDAAESTTYSFVARVTDSSGGTAARRFTVPIYDFYENMNVNAPATATVDSPFIVTVSLRDASDAVVPGALVHLQITNNVAGATSFDLVSTTNTDGNASFSVTIDKVGNGYTLVGWSPAGPINVSNISLPINVTNPPIILN
jgi:hypothetical protein